MTIVSLVCPAHRGQIALSCAQVRHTPSGVSRLEWVCPTCGEACSLGLTDAALEVVAHRVPQVSDGVAVGPPICHDDVLAMHEALEADVWEGLG